MTNREKISTYYIQHKEIQKSTYISSPVALYTHIVKLNSLNGLTKLTLNLVNKIRQFSKINSMQTLLILLNHRLPP